MNYDQTLCAYAGEECRERKGLHKRAWFVGIAMLLTLPFHYLMTMLCGRYILRAEEVMNNSLLDRLVFYVMYGGYYCAMLLVPVVIAALIFGITPRLPMTERRRIGLPAGVLVALFGMSFCILANYITNYWLMFAQQFGVEAYQGDYHSEGGWMPFVLNLITYALLPALVEELIFRGWFISALQPSGERCALVTSALLFGLVYYL